MKNTIIYTITDEAPALATKSLLPIIKFFLKYAQIEVDTKNISLANRVLVSFSEYLKRDQKVADDLSFLGDLVKKPDANIIKLPNISASTPQLKATIKELQSKGYNLPNYPEEPSTENEKLIKQRYDKIKGSAVNPVLREGNSDRRVPLAVKNFAKNNPHKMGDWSKNSKTHVSSMQSDDFFNNEKSWTMENKDTLKIVFIDDNGKEKILKNDLNVQKGEIIDATFMSKKALVKFLKEEMDDAKKQGILFSLHLKATMMKISDPIIFGHAVKVFFKTVFDKYQKQLTEAGIDPNNGLGELLSKLPNNAIKEDIVKEINVCLKNNAALAMVDSDKGITNLNVPSDIIIDASMPAMIRQSGKMWNKEGKTSDTKAVIPDSCYAGVYQTVINFCKKNGAFDPRTMGTVPNVGLMAQKAEEYGSHDKTFEIMYNGTIHVIDSKGNRLLSHAVEKGDIWRMCQVKDAPIQDWVKLAVNRAKLTKTSAVFWLDENRAHDAAVIKKVKLYLKNYDLSDVNLSILSPAKATEYTLNRLVKGENTISVTGNVLRDYLTDLFPIFEVGTSAKMLSIVPLMNGGGLFETGAGGSAPKHVQQFIDEGHLRWDSLGEFLALAASLEHLALSADNQKAKILANTLDFATEQLLMNDKSPKRKVHELDNKGSHYYLSLYWSEALSNQNEDLTLKTTFEKLFEKLNSKQDIIMDEINRIQGSPVDLGGYYLPDEEKSKALMCSSKNLNEIFM